MTQGPAMPQMNQGQSTYHAPLVIGHTIDVALSIMPEKEDKERFLQACAEPEGRSLRAVLLSILSQGFIMGAAQEHLDREAFNQIRVQFVAVKSLFDAIEAHGAKYKEGDHDALKPPAETESE